jgi:hypothetical protein
MKFVSKVIDPCTSFWVEDYTDEEREFFLSIGFEETIYRMPESFGGDQRNLGYQGSKPFGSWSQEEINKIAHAIYDQFPEIEQIEVFLHIPD